MQLQEVLWPNKYMMTVLGFWPMHPDTTRRRRIFIYLRIVVAILTQITLFVPHFVTVVINWGDIEILGDYGTLTVIFFLVTLKLLYYLSRQRSYCSMYQYIKDFWEISDDSEERANYERAAKLAKIVTIVTFLWVGIGNFVSIEAIPLIKWARKRQEINAHLYHRPLPMEIRYGFDTQQTPIYEIIFIWESICFVYTVCAVIGGDSTMIALIFHLAGQFKLINFRFRTIGRKIDEQIFLEGADEKIIEEIGKCVAQHQHTMQVTKELEALLNPLIFCQIMASSLEIGLSGYAVIEGESSSAELIKFLVIFVSMFIQLVTWCWPAEMLINESGAIAETIYGDIPWFKLTPRQKRDLHIIMLRAQKECHVSAFYQVLSTRKITEVFNAAGAYMAVLRNIRK